MYKLGELNIYEKCVKFPSSFFSVDWQAGRKIIDNTTNIFNKWHFFGITISSLNMV
jgi:hypothetical protein